MVRCRSLPAILLMTFVPASLMANSYVTRGVIVSVAPGGPKKPSTATIRGEVATPPDIEDLLVPVTFWGNETFLLDDKPANSNAMVSGRLLFHCKDIGMFRVFTRSYHFPIPEGTVDPSNAWWQIVVTKVAPVPQKPDDAKLQSFSDLLLHVRTRGGKVAAIVATTPRWRFAYGVGPVWHDVDASGLLVADGILAGNCRVTLQSSQGTSYADQKATKEIVINMSVPASGKGTAISEGRGPCETMAECRMAPVISPDYYAFLRAPGAACPATGDNRPSCMRLAWRVCGGVPEADHLGSNKMGGSEKPDNIEVEVKDDRLHAKVGFALRQQSTTSAIDAVVIGNRFFGTVTLTLGAKSWTVRTSGYLEEVDAPTIAWGEREAGKDIKALKAIDESGKAP